MAGSATAGAVTQKFVGPFGGTSPCNGEFVFGSGPGHAVYEQNDGHFVLHFAMRVKATGSLGNDYLLAVTANEQFEAPTLTFPDGTTAFDLPVRLLAVSHGARPELREPVHRPHLRLRRGTGGLDVRGPATETCLG